MTAQIETLLTSLRAVAEQTRLRMLFILSRGEFNVSEITQILNQSQPRVSRHLKLLTDAGLVIRHKEGNWVLFRLAEHGPNAELAQAIVALLPVTDDSLIRDELAISAIRQYRHEQALHYFRDNADNWQRLRSLHIDESVVEKKILEHFGKTPIKTLVDLGTGTGRMLELLGAKSEQLFGLDNSREMIALARTRLAQHGFHQAQLRIGDIYALPYPDSLADFVIIHQVLHFLDDPYRALREARRILKPQGRLLIIDFAPHERETLRDDHAHRRLGLSNDQIKSWLSRCDLQLIAHDLLPPPRFQAEEGLSVSLWQASPLPQTIKQPQSIEDKAP